MCVCVCGGVGGGELQQHSPSIISTDSRGKTMRENKRENKTEKKKKMKEKEKIIRAARVAV